MPFISADHGFGRKYKCVSQLSDSTTNVNNFFSKPPLKGTKENAKVILKPNILHEHNGLCLMKDVIKWSVFFQPLYLYH